MLTRRTALLSAVAATALSAVSARTASATPSAAGPVRLTLPAPGGPHPVGTVSLRLVDTARADPWITAQAYRELMISVRYPARDTGGHPRAPQMLPGEAAGFTAVNNLTDVPADKVDWAATRTHAHEDAPADRDHGPYPVVCYSPGTGDPRSLGATLCDDLASRGYVVVMLDHTYDATAVQFPGGHVERTVLPAEYDKAYPDKKRIRALLKKTIDVRVADTRFLLDELPRALPRALRGISDLDRIGMFGHSAGGFTALQTMHEDRRVAAGANMDGVVAYVPDDGDSGHLSTVAAEGLDRPFLLLGKDGNDLSTVPSWNSLWRHSRGPREGLTLRGAEHATFTDEEALIPQIARRLGLPRATVVKNIGTIAPARAIPVARACLASFFDRRLHGREVAGPSATAPELLVPRPW
ncbi:hydrolase [Streptomyces sp. Ag109_O5-10]|uniref:alpha/beta hydrolase family protein n=1 Tax=Streptomyces sp. Ag109_O5-10 TaxID=1855349 RepID=UPI000895193D|nr:hydrolase [Streptomyces sp. Ag109_O5-10]SEF17055.1 Platelet-activating factor acetylhydrolase, isoform II [Streptomyces sp. Ag109_O5-10]